jgi:hypothetical protein
MSCLYASDYGSPETGFDPLADSGRLIKGFEAHTVALARATNPGQLEAMQRALRREDMTWCDPGYGWVEGGAVHALFAAIFVGVIVPYAVWVLRTRRRERTSGPAALRFSRK